MTPLPRSALGALGSHRFLMRAAFAAANAFSWVFVLQFFFVRSHSVSEAFVQTIILYALSQTIGALATPYTASRLSAGSRRLMIYATVLAAVSFAFLAAGLSGASSGSLGVLGFAVCMGLYRAAYWVPYAIEREFVGIRSVIPQELFIALMPAIAGYSLFDGPLGALTLLISAILLLIAALAPIFSVPDFHERFSWSYRETFAELFEPKYNPLVESAFLEGVQGAALLLLWPLSVFLITGSSYKLLGLVLTLSLLLSIPMRAFGAKLVEGKKLLHATLAASSWIMRLAVATPFGAIVVDAYSSAGVSPAGTDAFALEQSSENSTYLDELSALKEIALSVGRLSTCAVAAICIAFFSLSAGIAAAFLFAAGASVVSIVARSQVRDF